ncbi:putative arsenical pump membrane protein [Candidatus Nitrososphaera gargensis Ga9.2]|uniref:Putative arsenical pump membrane protein n=2 Tax=Candidatus Nitrososphaera gargensis TaxID=497727 RepID=K0IHT6_NITGG|nr:putative arsenical pump membrane protein [Candidatus Nitrososphaera gargensis Ga9.2]
MNTLLHYMQEYIALGVFAVVYTLIIGRRRFGVPIWAAMLIGAALMIGLQVIGVEAAFMSVNLDVIAFLFGMFSIVSALDRAGVLRRVAIRMLAVAKTPDRLLMAFVVGMGLLAAFLVNDTIALLGIPLVVYVARHAGIRPVVLLIALAFGITVGSVMTPVGNPQNLLIAIESGILMPFTTFLVQLAAPTIVNLFMTYAILKVYYRKEIKLNYQLSAIELAENTDRVYSPRLAKISIAVLVATIAGFIVSEALHFLGIVEFSLSTVAMLGSAAIYAVSDQRREIMKSVDYSVLVFFGGMFVVTSALWSSGAVSLLFMNYIPTPDPADPVQSATVISAASIGISQVLSNVPFVALYNFVMTDSGFTGQHVDQWMMLAAASTIAGNLTILGAASNIIIIEAAESRGVTAFSFLEFFKVGSIVTAANLAVYYVFIVLI